jgi:hypothetical protein
LLEADAAKESVIKGAPELIAALKRAYAATESKLSGTTTPEGYEAINDRMMSQTDPDAALVRRGSGDSRPRYHHHRAIDDHKGVITAVETTPGSIAENKKLMGLIEQHEANTASPAETNHLRIDRDVAVGSVAVRHCLPHKAKVNRPCHLPQRMIAAHPLLQVDCVAKEFALALLLSHHGTIPLPNRSNFGYYYF